jgi:peptidoglycan/xylan/chitin deacetylase (PgdA/CDA1 family)
VLTRIVHSPAGGRLLALLEGVESRRANLLRILTYHRVPDGEVFGEHMRYLRSHYNVVGTHDLLEVYGRQRTLPPRSVMVTFDDAYRDFADQAWPVLKGLGLPVTVFVPTAFPDRPEKLFWWDRLEYAFRGTPRRDELSTRAVRLPLGTDGEREQSLSRVKFLLKDCRPSELEELTAEICASLEGPPPSHEVLGWADLRRLAREGVTLGAHTRSHPLMSRITLEEAREEALGSLADLRREIGEVPPIFAYPDGRHNQAAVEAVRGAGFALAFTTRRGTNDLSRADPLQLRRINISRDARLPVLRARLIHSSVYLNPWRRFFDRQPAIHK